MDRTSIHSALAQVYPQISGLEYGDYRRLVADFAAAECTAAEYCRRIGAHNLRSYLDTIEARERAAARGK